MRKDVDPRRVNIEGMMKRYSGTPVVEETLSKLFHERMDIEGTMDLMSDIQNGRVSVVVTGPGPLGQSPRSERDVTPRLERQGSARASRDKALSERCVLICINCSSTDRKRVGRLENGIDDCSCVVAG